MTTIMRAECIRRSKSYWTTCPCDTCVLDRKRATKRLHVGLPHRVPQDIAWAKLARAIDDGWTARALGSATGRDADYFSRHVAARRRGDTVLLGPTIAADIMRMGVPTEGQIGAEPSRRRLRALACMGYGLNTLVDDTGISFSTLAMIRGNNARVSAALAVRITAAYERLHMTPGPDGQARAHARTSGWLPPLAYNRIDDALEQPTDWAYTPADRGELVDDMLQSGATLSDVLRHLKINAEALEKWCDRTGRRAAFNRLLARERGVA